MPASADSLVALAAALLLGGALVALTAGGLLLAKLRLQTGRSYFFLRKHSLRLAWGRILLGLALLMGFGITLVFGRTAAALLAPAANTVTPAPSAGPGTPPPTRTAPAPPPAVHTATATAAASATATPPAGPQLPLALVTLPAGTLTVTPSADAVIANLRVSALNDCASRQGADANFARPPKTFYALFDYDGWLPGMQWSSVWLRDGQVVFVETLLWDGSTGGCGFSEFNAGGQAWAEGVYEVQLFAGQRWLGSAGFSLFRRTPTPSPTP